MEAMLEKLKNIQIENIVLLTNILVEFSQKFGFKKGNKFFRMDLPLSNAFKK